MITNNERETSQTIRRMNEHSTSLLMMLLLSTDLVFIVLHIINATPILDSPLFNITVPGGYADTYRLVKLLWIIILLVSVLRSARYSGYVSWILVFAYFLFDDVLHIHGIIGSRIAESFYSYLPHNLGLTPRAFAEFAWLAIAGMFLFIIVAWAYLKGPHVFRKVSHDMLLLSVALVLFGVFVDLTQAVKPGPIARFGLMLLEDGGELVVVSLILWYVFLLAMRNGKPDLFLHDLLCKALTRRRT